MKPFVIYCPQINQLEIIDNDYGLDYDLAMYLLRTGLKKNYTLEFIGELWKLLWKYIYCIPYLQ